MTVQSSIQSHLAGKLTWFTTQAGIRFFSVNRLTMTLTQCLGTAEFVVVIIGIGLSLAAEAHRDHHHRNRRSQRSIKPATRAIDRLTKKAIENTRRRIGRPYYGSYCLVCDPMISSVPKRVIVVPAPWIVDLHPYHHGNRVNGGFGFNL